MTPRQEVIAEAYSWLGTPYHHNARVKRVGVDCGQILYAVYGATGNMRDMPPPEYMSDWNMNHEDERFLQFLELGGATRTDAPQSGDIAVYKFYRCFSHGAILVSETHVIHSYIGRGVVLSGMHEAPLRGRPVLYYAPPWKEAV